MYLNQFPTVNHFSRCCFTSLPLVGGFWLDKLIVWIFGSCEGGHGMDHPDIQFGEMLAGCLMGWKGGLCVIWEEGLLIVGTG